MCEDGKVSVHGSATVEDVEKWLVEIRNRTTAKGRKFLNEKQYEMVEKVGLYWHFVDLVWVFVFTFFYLV